MNPNPFETSYKRSSANSSLNLRNYRTLKLDQKKNLSNMKEMYMISKAFISKWKKEGLDSSFCEEQINSDLLYSNGKLKENLKENQDFKLVSKDLWDLLSENALSIELKVLKVNGQWEVEEENLSFIYKKTSFEKNSIYCKIGKIFAHKNSLVSEIFHLITSKITAAFNGESCIKPNVLTNTSEKPLKIWLLHSQAPNKTFTEKLNLLRNSVQTTGKAYVSGQAFKIKSLSEWNSPLNSKLIENRENLLIEITEPNKGFFLYNDEEFYVGQCENCKKKSVLSYICPCKIMTFCSERCRKDSEHFSSCEIQNTLSLKNQQKSPLSHGDLPEIVSDNNFCDICKKSICLMFICPICEKMTYCSEKCRNSDMNHKCRVFELSREKTKKRDVLVKPVGMENLGNTCYMNATIQCLAHTQELSNHFLKSEILKENSTGRKEVVLLQNYVFLLRQLKTNPQKSFSISPILFKKYLSTFNSMFSGGNQHDAQELLIILLDAFHEALKFFPPNAKENLEFYDKMLMEKKEISLEKEAKIFQDFYNSKNGYSIISSLFQGIFKSQIKCKKCGNISKNFEPFFLCSLPIYRKPKKKKLDFYYEQFEEEYSFLKITLTYEKKMNLKIKDLKALLSKKFSTQSSEIFLKNVISKDKTFQYSDDYQIENFQSNIYPPKLLIRPFLDFETSIPEAEKILLYISLKSPGKYSFKHFYDILPCNQFLFASKGETLAETHYKIYKFMARQKLISEKFDFLQFCDNYFDLGYEVKIGRLNYFLTNENKEIFPFTNSVTLGDFIISQKKSGIFSLDVELNQSLVGAVKPVKEELIFIGEENESLEKNCDVYDCLNYMTKEEHLDELNKWKCSNCNIEQLCSKKLDIYNAGPILIIHFKRNKPAPSKKKINTKIDFPIIGFDLNDFIISKEFSNKYDLYAICNHYGDAHGGHYTVFCKNSDDLWFVFDDEKVEQINNNQLITENAYILFYRLK